MRFFIAGSSNGDPQYSLLTLVLYLYNVAFYQLNPGYAAALGAVLFVFIFGATVIQKRLFGNTEAA